MKRSQLPGAVCTCVLTFITATSQAALVSQLGGQAVYDTDLDITWLANANLASSNSFGVAGIGLFGLMDWDTANHWIMAMNADGGTGYLGFNDWRMPTTLVPDSSCINSFDGTPSNDAQGLNCTGSEMGHLFYTEFGAQSMLGGYALDTANPDELAKFSAIGYDNNITRHYWSATEYVLAPAPATAAMFFNFDSGEQLASGKYVSEFVWAVRSGDVAAVPVPASLWLFGSGLLGLIGISRHKKAA